MEASSVELVTALTGTLTDHAMDVRRQSALSLDWIGKPAEAAMPVLEEKLEDPDDKPAINAAYAHTQPLLSLVRCYSLTNRLPGNCRITPFNSSPNNTANA